MKQKNGLKKEKENDKMSKERRKVSEGLKIVLRKLENEMVLSKKREDSHFSFNLKYTPPDIGFPYPESHDLLTLTTYYRNNGLRHEDRHEFVRSTRRPNTRWYKYRNHLHANRGKFGRPLK